ncbi:MAG: WD40 repeat domain-containing protein [Bdellovibrionales bacterium]
MTASPIAAEWNVEGAVTALAISRDDKWLAVGSGSGNIYLLDIRSGNPDFTVIAAHDGACLSLAPDLEDGAFLSGGDDGRVVSVSADGVQELASHKGAWIEHVATAPELGQRLYAERKNLHRLDADGNVFGAPLEHPTTVAGIGVDTKQKRVACAHYNGVTLWWLKPEKTTAETLEWKGSHTGVLWHPKEQIVLSMMQEPALHGWRLTDMQEMRMSGYHSKVQSIAFMEGGKYLASAGSDQVICWPFFGGGPWGKSPLGVGPDAGSLVSLVATHSQDPLIAVGYAHGGLALVPLYEGGSLQLLAPTNVPLTAMQWTAAGDALFAGDENGKLYLFTVESVSAAFKPM